MADVIFDGPNKLIIVKTGVTYLPVKDVYSAWKVWTLQDDNAKYEQAMSYIGADPIPGGQLGTTFFLENGWKIRPYEGNHTLTVVGNLYSRDGSDPYVSTIGTYNVRIVSVVSTLVETIVQAGIGTPEQVRNAVWGATNLSSYGAGSAGEKLDAVGTSANPWLTDLSSYNTPNTAGYLVKQTANNANSIKTTVENMPSAIRTELTPELAKIMAMESNPGLTEDQATMLLAIYRIHGLDPTRPLIVTKTSRTAGSEIQQQINSNDNQTIVTRV